MDPGAVSWVVDTNIEDWTATSSESWCKPVTGSTELLLQIEAYDARDDNGQYQYDPPRTCTVTVKAGQTRDLVVSSNAYRWVPTTDASWLKVECVDNATLRLISAARSDSDTQPRSAVVKVYVETDQLNYETFTVLDAPASVEGNDFGYGDHTDWN